MHRQSLQHLLSMETGIRRPPFIDVQLKERPLGFNLTYVERQREGSDTTLWLETWREWRPSLVRACSFSDQIPMYCSCNTS